MPKKVLQLLSILLSIISLINSNHTSKVSYTTGTNLTIKVGSLFSKEYIIPFTYNSINICNDNNVIPIEDSIGDILTGESLYYSKYVTKVNETEYCKILCYNKISNETKSRIEKLIEKNYTTNWYIDELPAGLITYDNDYLISTIKYFHGIPLGYSKNGTFYIYNHLQFHIILSKIEEDKYIVVGFNILPISIKHNNDNGICSNDSEHIFDNLNQSPQELIEGDVLFTYDIIYEYSDISLAARWDHYQNTEYTTQWGWIFISEFLIFLITVIIVVILRKSLSDEIDSFNFRVSQAEYVDEYDWKQVGGDVFRPPSVHMKLLAALLGSGTQLFLMMTITIFFSLIGFSSPEKRKNIINLGILIFCFMGLPGGYVSALFYRFWGGTKWIYVAILNAVLFPGGLFCGYIFINIILKFKGSNAAVHFYDIMSFFILWIFCTFPLILIGAFLGVKSKKLVVPCEINRISSTIPEKPCYLHNKYMVFVTGFIGFSTVFVQINYVMASLWKNEIFFLATFFGISFFLFIIIVGEMSVLFVFLNLCAFDYNWWWKSFIMGCSPVIYLVIYSIIYCFYLKISSLSAIAVYFGIMGIIWAMISLISGSMSLFFNFAFLKIIYSKLRKD